MCIGCNPYFLSAVRGLSAAGGARWPSRRDVLKGAGAFAAGAGLLAEAVTPPAARADGSLDATFARGLGGAGPAGAPGPVTIYTARKIVTMERDAPLATAIAVDGTRIAAVGTLEEVQQALAGRTCTVDESLAGRVVLPGLIDQHLHPILGALTLAVEVIAIEDWRLPGRTVPAAKNQDEYRARLRAAEAALTTPDAWLFTWGYHALWHGPLDRAALDAISATRPIAVWQRSCHEFYLNTAALKALGLTRAAVGGGKPGADQANWEEGHFWEDGLNLMVGPLLQAMATPERLEFGLRQMVATLHAHGVTAYNEPGALYTPSMWTLYERVLGDPATPMYSTFLADGRGIPDRVGLARALDATAEQIAVAPEGPGRKLMFFPGQIKLFADGAIISQLMQMKDGYLDGHHGEWIIPPDEFARRFRLYWNAGYRIHIHVNGDLGLDMVLDTLEKSLAEKPRADHRTVIVHFANSSEEQVARIRRLGAIVSANPYYPSAFADKYGAVGLGPERADAMVRAASVLRAGIPLSYHSDLPMAPSDPLYLAWCGVNRLTPAGRVAGPEQRVSVDDALRAVTIEAAYAWGKEAWIGSLAAGKIANLTVLEQDPYAVPPETLKDIPVWGTMFEGRLFPVTA